MSNLLSRDLKVVTSDASDLMSIKLGTILIFMSMLRPEEQLQTTSSLIFVHGGVRVRNLEHDCVQCHR